MPTIIDADSDYASLGLADPAMAQAQLERVTADFGRMYRERNEALRALARAHHEASHAVVASVLGARVGTLEIWSGPPVGGRPEEGPRRRALRL